MSQCFAEFQLQQPSEIIAIECEKAPLDHKDDCVHLEDPVSYFSTDSDQSRTSHSLNQLLHKSTVSALFRDFRNGTIITEVEFIMPFRRSLK